MVVAHFFLSLFFISFPVTSRPFPALPQLCELANDNLLLDSIRLARSNVNSKQKKKNQVSQLHSFSVWGISICIQLFISSWRMHHEEPEPEGLRLTVHAQAFRFHRLLPEEFCSCCRQHIGKSQKLKDKQQQQHRCQSYYSRQHLVQNIQS